MEGTSNMLDGSEECQRLARISVHELRRVNTIEQ